MDQKHCFLPPYTSHPHFIILERKIAHQLAWHTKLTFSSYLHFIREQHYMHWYSIGLKYEWFRKAVSEMERFPIKCNFFLWNASPGQGVCGCQTCPSPGQKKGLRQHRIREHIAWYSIHKKKPKLIWFLGPDMT